MPRVRFILAALVVCTSCFFAYNLWFRPLPDAAEIRTILQNKPFVGVMDPRTGEQLPSPSSAELHVSGIYPLSSSVVTTYYSSQGQGVGRMERGLLGWDFSVFSWGPVSALTQANTIAYDYRQQWGEYGLPFAEVVYGTRIDARASSVRVLFDNKETIQQAMENDHFSIATDKNGAACLVQVVDTSNVVIEEIRLTPRIPDKVDSSRYDCDIKP